MKTLRCAIYTRKSSEEGLEQDFNSLHAQREACEAYIRSQAGEGWTCLKTAYDDGGISGGTMERPALKALLADIAAGKVDVVVVYKVDRLTRSLTDFAKIVEVFDKRTVSFVSITQAFNTTSSMGRLTLNVLLSFAQFEREVTGERIRDKIAASKKKGLWMGGILPLGYDPNGRTFTVNVEEAKLVRQIFDRYLELGSVHVLANELDAEGIRSKRWTTRTGKAMGGYVMRRGALYHLLSNPLYIGQITHKGQTYPGQHPAIIDVAVFERARSALAEKAPRSRDASKTPPSFPLAGKIFDRDGLPMSPSTTRNRHGKRYRYYVSVAVMCGGRSVDVEGLRRLPADLIERTLTTLLAGAPGISRDQPLSSIQRVRHSDQALSITIDGQGERSETHGWASTIASERGGRLQQLDGDLIELHFPLRLELRGGQRRIEGDLHLKPVQLDAALRRAHSVARVLGVSILTGAAGEASASLESTYERSLAPLSFLAPDIQRALVVEGGGLASPLQNLLRSPPPLLWTQQRKLLDIAGG